MMNMLTKGYYEVNGIYTEVFQNVVKNENNKMYIVNDNTAIITNKSLNGRIEFRVVAKVSKYVYQIEEV